MKAFENIIGKCSMCLEVCDLSWLVVVGDAQHDLPNQDLVWVTYRAHSAKGVFSKTREDGIDVEGLQNHLFWGFTYLQRWNVARS